MVTFNLSCERITTCPPCGEAGERMAATDQTLLSVAGTEMGLISHKITFTNN